MKDIAYPLVIRALKGLLLFLVSLSFIALAAHRTPAQTLPLFRIANGNTGETPAALWLGVERGFYRNHGVNVEIVFVRGGVLSMTALASGEVQMVFVNSNVVLNAAAGGLDVAIFGNIASRPEGDFMARPEIKKPEDLRGKSVATQSIGGGGWAIMMLALDYLNLDPERDQIRFLMLGDQPSRVQALESGRAQASWLGSAYSAPLKKKGYTLLLDMLRAPIAYLGGSLVTRRTYVRQEPKLYEAILKGTLDALRFISKPENKAAVLQIMARNLRLNRPEEAETAYQAITSVYSKDMHSAPEGIKKIHSILARGNPKLQQLRAEEIIDNSLIRKIQESRY